MELKDLYEEQKGVDETFRDHLATMDEKGKRLWVYPKKPKGRFTNYRSLVSYFLLLVLITSPFVKIGEYPLLLFDILQRRFVIFGQVFWPQDFFLFVIGMITSIVFISLFTVVFGRIFCGWICPQTIFMEGVFRKVEYWIEGDYMSQKKLDKQPWNQEKIIKKTGKHIIFIFISIVIMHTFMAYLVGIEKVWEMINQGPVENMGGFIAMIVMTLLFYGVFTRLREQVCTTICPYGRLQGVLLDQHSMVVAYDHKRGETRSKFRKNEDRASVGKGDCIDCKQCVYVCPTGIDIRNGTQLECVNCTACIDACDSIMERIGRPKGLVRYASEQNITDKLPFKFTGRIKAYTILLVILLGVLTVLLISRSDFEMTILRTPGMTFQERKDGMISNLYQLKMINKTYEVVDVRLRLLEPKEGMIEYVGNSIQLQKQEIGEGAFFVVIDPNVLNNLSSKIMIGVYNGEEQVAQVKTKFIGPAK